MRLFEIVHQINIWLLDVCITVGFLVPVLWLNQAVKDSDIVTFRISLASLAVGILMLMLKVHVKPTRSGLKGAVLDFVIFTVQVLLFAASIYALVSVAKILS